MLSNMKWTNMYVTESEVTFTFDSVLKHNRGKSEPPMVFRAYTHEPTLCPVTTVGKYLDFRRDKSGEPELFITSRPTKGVYKAATSDTIARWIKKTMGLAGIDTGKFTAHTCRSAATSSADFRGIGISTIIKSASWSNSKTFKKFYLKEIEQAHSNPDKNFGVETLENFSNNV